MTSQPQGADAGTKVLIFGETRKYLRKYLKESQRKQSLAERERHGEGENVACEKRTSLAKGEKKPANREKGTGKQGERYVLARCHRPPSQIRAGALTSWSTRPFMLERTAEPDFYSLALSFLGKYSQRRLSRTFHRRG